MGFPLLSAPTSQQPEALSPTQVSPTTLALLARSLPPDKLRILLTVLFTSYTQRQQRAVGQILISSIPDTITDILLPRRTSTALLAAERLWSDVQIEKSLSDGTAFNLVPALSIFRTGTASNAHPQLRWVWRSVQTLPTQTAPIESAARADTSFTDQLRVRPETMLNMLARDIEDTIFQSLSDELSRLTRSSTGTSTSTATFSGAAGSMPRPRNDLMRTATTSGQFDASSPYTTRSTTESRALGNRNNEE